MGIKNRFRKINDKRELRYLLQETSLEVNAVQRYLNLLPGRQAFVDQSHTSTDDALANPGVHWMCAKPESLLFAWCNQFTMFVNKQPSVGRVGLVFIIMECKISIMIRNYNLKE